MVNRHCLTSEFIVSVMKNPMIFGRFSCTIKLNASQTGRVPRYVYGRWTAGQTAFSLFWTSIEADLFTELRPINNKHSVDIFYFIDALQHDTDWMRGLSMIKTGFRGI